ncbi:hypothetical protein RFI_24490 [Reticulomyxa filosa]|uniref:Uncharacterized protein n=1 Tax=Reticulomyxa filosa TaxID=46433 RepID=X6MHL4_RETFI|nr:hypothetical protein RFI_24490 [Reticulomyxa filosa]|eukprot:ETO12887.1 hypothetical protein RFI_24490 [Reticulomyxa filosa]
MKKEENLILKTNFLTFPIDKAYFFFPFQFSYHFGKSVLGSNQRKKKFCSFLVSPFGFGHMSFQASICIENKIYEVGFASLSLKNLEDKVKELVGNRTEPKNLPLFKITNINGQNIDNDQKLQIAFDITNPVRLFIHFIDKNNDEEMKSFGDKEQDVKNIELEQDKPWNEANKTAMTIVDQMTAKKQKGIVIVSTNLDQFAKPNNKLFFQDVPFTMMINSNQYMKKKKVIPPYTIYSFHSKNIIFDNITINGCVYAVDCIIDGTDDCHITQYLIHTKQSVIRYTFKKPVFTVPLPIDMSNLLYAGTGACDTLNFDKAIWLFRFSLCFMLQTFGDSNIYVSRALVWLGNAYQGKGDYDKAIEYYERSLKVLSEHLKPDHIDFASLYSNLGNPYDRKGQFNKAIEYAEKALKIALDNLGPDHVDVGDSYNDLGLYYQHKGEYDKSLAYHQKALKICLEKLGDNNKLIAVSYINLGRVYFRKAEYDKAYEYYTKALNIYSEKTDQHQIFVANCHVSLGAFYHEKGEYSKSIEYHKKAIKVYLDKLGENHTEVSTAFSHLGAVYFEIGEYETSIGYYEKALNILLKKFGERHAFVAISYNELGLVWIKGKKQVNKAKEYIAKALEILMDDKDDNFNLQLANSYDMFGLILKKNGTNERAIEYFEKSLEIKFKKLNDDHPCVGWSFHYLASVFKNKNELNKSIEFGERALKLRLKKLDYNHPHVGESYILLGDIHVAKGEKNKAKEFYENAVKIFNQVFGEQHQKTQDVKLVLEKMNENNQDHKEEKKENEVSYFYFILFSLL